MIDNAHRAAWDALYRDQRTLERISSAAETLADQLDPDTDPGHTLYALAGDAWTHRENGRDIIETGTLDGQLPADEVRAWLEGAAQIIERAQEALA